MLIDDALSLRLAALVVVAGVVKAAIETDMERPIALRTLVAKTNALFDADFPSAMKAVHGSNYRPKASRRY